MNSFVSFEYGSDLAIINRGGDLLNKHKEKPEDLIRELESLRNVHGALLLRNIKFDSAQDLEIAISGKIIPADALNINEVERATPRIHLGGASSHVY